MRGQGRRDRPLRHGGEVSLHAAVRRPSGARGLRISGQERQRYDCQLVLKEVGERGQDALRAGSALVVGAGGLGAPVLFYLAAAGVGRIGIVDDDVVELSNLQRQILFTTADIGRPKAEVAAERLAALNPEVALEPHTSRLRAATASVADRPLRRRRHRGGQLPDALPAQRRLRAGRQDAGRRGGAAHDRPRDDHQGRRDGLLPLPLPGASAAGRRHQLLGGRGARSDPRPHRLHPGARGDQGAHRRRAARCTTGCCSTTAAS